MKINLVNTSEGFKPATDEDYEKKRSLKKGMTYECTIKEKRNLKFHRLYFALFNCAWSCLEERQRKFFKDKVDSFRETVEVCAGHYELCYSVARKEWIEKPKSIAFDKLSENDFSSLYERCKDVLYSMFLQSTNKDIFEQQLKYF